MSKGQILWVDDDRTRTTQLAEWLRADGFVVHLALDAAEASRLITELHEHLIAIVVDVVIPSADAPSELRSLGDSKAGILLASWVKRRYPQIDVIGYSLDDSDEVRDWFEHNNAVFLSKKTSRFRLIDYVKRTYAEGGRRKREPKMFIVHGHDGTAKLELKNYLQNVLKLGEPTILHEQPSFGRTIIDKLEAHADDIDLVFVLLTPDDKVATSNDSNESRRRARQNVIFEAGYFYGRLQRVSGRVLLLVAGNLELPSDISGVVYIDISGGIGAAGEDIRRELRRWLS